MVASADSDRLASLFEAVTGRSTITESQRVDDRRDGEQASEISTYLHDTVMASGLDDAVAEPDTN